MPGAVPTTIQAPSAARELQVDGLATEIIHHSLWRPALNALRHGLLLRGTVYTSGPASHPRTGASYVSS